MSQQDFLTIYTAAVLGDYTPLTIRSAIKTSKLPAEKFNGIYRIKRADLIAWLATKGRSIQGGA